ncbi:34569_t:CDS:2, partial [Racocetra persica]
KELKAFIQQQLMRTKRHYTTKTIEMATKHILVDELIAGVDAALDLLKTWLGMWIHLSLSICRLGGDNRYEFAYAYAKVILKMPWNYNTTKIQYYIQELEYNIDSGTEFQDFGLCEALKDPAFFEEF